LNERRSYRKYFWEEDMNGKYLVNLNESEDSWLSADYVYVHFNLAMPEPFLEGNVFVYGSFNNWLRTEKNQMTYNFSNKMYEATVLLKQGYYNYTYAYYNVFTNVLDDAYIEGSHFQTENDYIIAVYYRDFDYKYDRLIGYRVINSKYQQ